MLVCYEYSAVCAPGHEASVAPQILILGAMPCVGRIFRMCACTSACMNFRSCVYDMSAVCVTVAPERVWFVFCGPTTNNRGASCLPSMDMVGMALSACSRPSLALQRGDQVYSGKNSFKTKLHLKHFQRFVAFQRLIVIS